MLKRNRAFFGIALLVFSLTALPVSSAIAFKGSAYSFLRSPLAFSCNVAQTARDFFCFWKNAEENKALKKALAEARLRQFQQNELIQENTRLTRLLNLKQALPSGIKRVLFSRVIARSPLAWNRVVLIDKGSRQGVKPSMLVLSELSVVGKIMEVGPSASKVLLIADPNSRIGVLIQRTRQQGVLFGTSKGECRIKYLSMDTPIKAGDVVETAGFGGFFPKGLLVGRIERVWKEPGQIYQVAQVKPLSDLNRIEEVSLVE